MISDLLLGELGWMSGRSEKQQWGVDLVSVEHSGECSVVTSLEVKDEVVNGGLEVSVFRIHHQPNPTL